MPKKTASTDQAHSEAVGDDQPAVKAAVKVEPKGEPVDLVEGTDQGPFDDLKPDTAPETATDDLDLDTPVSEDEFDSDRTTVFTPVNAMEAFEEAMAAHPNSCLKHMLLEWKAQETEARKFEERQRVRGDL